MSIFDLNPDEISLRIRIVMRRALLTGGHATGGKRNPVIGTLR